MNIFDCWYDQTLFDSKLEFAIRSWSIQSEEIRLSVQEADDERLNVLMNMYQKFGRSTIEAEVSSRTLYLVQIGYITMQTKEPLEIRIQWVAGYVNAFTGEYPSESEIKRFQHRHGYDPKELV